MLKKKRLLGSPGSSVVATLSILILAAFSTSSLAAQAIDKQVTPTHRRTIGVASQTSASADEGQLRGTSAGQATRRKPGSRPKAAQPKSRGI